MKYAQLVVLCLQLDEVYVVSKSGITWAFEVTDALEATTLLPGDFIIVPSYL